MGFITRAIGGLFGFGDESSSYVPEPPAPVAVPPSPIVPQAPANTAGASDTAREEALQKATSVGESVKLLRKRRQIDINNTEKEREQRQTGEYS